MNPDPTRHEASRKAFDSLGKHYDMSSYPQYTLDQVNEIAWKAWQAALDWRDAQVCEWKECEKDFLNETGCNRTIAYLKSDLIDFPFCPACGRRVKIMDNSETTP